MSSSETERVTRGFSDHSLPEEEWTHEAHLRVGLWHLLHFFPGEALDRLRSGIRAYNVASGVVNSDTSGYHETITRIYVVLVQHFLDTHDRDMP